MWMVALIIAILAAWLTLLVALDGTLVVQAVSAISTGWGEFLEFVVIVAAVYLDAMHTDGVFQPVLSFPLCIGDIVNFFATVLYSKMSPGWQSKALQIASNVDKRTAFAFPFFRIDRLAMVIPTFSDNSVTLIFRFASMTSILMMIAIIMPLHG